MKKDSNLGLFPLVALVKRILTANGERLSSCFENTLEYSKEIFLVIVKGYKLLMVKSEIICLDNFSLPVFWILLYNIYGGGGDNPVSSDMMQKLFEQMGNRAEYKMENLQNKTEASHSLWL